MKYLTKYVIILIINVNEQLKIKQSLSIQSDKAILSIPINSTKYKQICFELKYENAELVEILLDTIDKLMKKNEDFQKRLLALEEKVFGKKEKETKKENDEFKWKFENLTNTKTIQPHTSYISNIILLQNNKLATSSHDGYIKIYNKDTFEPEISIKENSYIDWIEQVKDGTLISCPRDNTIRLYEIKDKSYNTINVLKESSSAWKMKELQSGKLISSMSNYDIKVWIKKNDTLECEFIIPNGGESYDILEIRKNEVVALSSTNVNKSYQLISKIECKKIVTLYKISNDFILSGQSIGDIKQWQCIGRETKLSSYKNKGNNSDVTAFLKLNEIILSGDGAGNIKFWGY